MKDVDSYKKLMAKECVPDTPWAWCELVHDAILFILDAVSETMEMLADTATRNTNADIDLGKRVDALEDRIEKLSQEKKLVAKVVEFSIAKLDPDPDGVVVFWLPGEADLSHNQVQNIAKHFEHVVNGRFRFIVLIKDSVDIEIVSPGQSDNSKLYDTKIN